MPNLRKLAAVICRRSYLFAFANTSLTVSIKSAEWLSSIFPDFSKNAAARSFTLDTADIVRDAIFHPSCPSQTRVNQDFFSNLRHR